MNLRERLTQRLQQDRDGIVQLCADLVRLPSENPPGDTRQVADYVTRSLERRGLAYEVVAPQPALPNIVATIEGGEPGRHLVLNGHMDVFPAGDPARWARDPFSGAVVDGKLYGRGVSDMKAGVTASLTTFALLAEARQYLKGKLTLTLVSDEETFGPWGARYLMEHRPDVHGDALLSGEPSTPRLARYGEKGLLWLELTTATRGGHGGYAHVSPNAIKEAGKIIADLESLGSRIEVASPPEVLADVEAARACYDDLLGADAADTLKAVTVNIGTIRGGAKVNMIAGDCLVEVDIRCPVGVTTEQALAAFEAILARHPAGNPTYRVINRSESHAVAPDSALMRLVATNAETVFGVRPLPSISLGGTDARLWRLRGIPAVVFGPTPNNMGAPDEYVDIDELLGITAVHVLTAYDYLDTLQA
jgi:succinyl-diaminopimelate desuccinylase